MKKERNSLPQSPCPSERSPLAYAGMKRSRVKCVDNMVRLGAQSMPVKCPPLRTNVFSHVVECTLLYSAISGVRYIFVVCIAFAFDRVRDYSCHSIYSDTHC